MFFLLELCVFACECECVAHVSSTPTVCLISEQQSCQCFYTGACLKTFSVARDA